jgi:hypothetical protein
MRCPKCGFISFDHLTSCAKCRKDIAEVASELQGTSIKVETPMFLGTALAAYADRETSFEEHAMEVDEGIDFSMDDEGVGEEAVEVADAEENVDFSFEAEGADVDISLAEEKVEKAVDFSSAEEVSSEASEESFEELDLMGTIDEEEDGGLEFDLDDFIEDMDDDKSKSSGSADIDLNLDDD